MKQIFKNLTFEERVSLLCGQTFWKSRSLPEKGVNAITFSDGPCGLRVQSGQSDALGLHAALPSTCYPVPGTMANSWDPQLFFRVGQQMGRTAKELEIDVVLAPCLNVKRNPLGGRNFEYISNSPYLCQVLGQSMIEGLEENVFSCPKHFLLNSQESYRTSVDEQVSETSLHQDYLKPFLACAPLLNFTMSAYNRVNGTYCHENQYLDRIYREAGFQGMILSDWGGSNRVEDSQFSLHLEMPSTGTDSINTLLRKADQDPVFAEILFKRSEEFLTILEKVEKKRSTPLTGKAQNHLALEAARKSIVLLKNDHLLPLKKEQRILWIGNFDAMPFQGGGSSHVNAAEQESFSSLREHFFGKNSIWIRDYDAERIQQQAVSADLCVFLGDLAEKNFTEGVDRMDKELPFEQRQILHLLQRKGVPTVLVYAGPAGLSMNPSFLKGFVYAGLAGEKRLEALMELLSGKENFSAALAEPFFLADHDNLQVKKDLVIRENEVLEFPSFCKEYRNKEYYPLGFGLSYSTFEIQNVQPKNLQVQVEVKNTGSVDGEWIGQLYLQQERQNRLCGFKKVKIPAGVQKSVSIPVDPQIFYEYLPGKGWTLRKEGRLFLGKDERCPICFLELEAVRSELHFQTVSSHLPAKKAGTLDFENWPLELYENCDQVWFSSFIRFLKKIRNRSLESNHPSWVLVSTLNNSPRALYKLSNRVFSHSFVSFCKRSFIRVDPQEKERKR